LRARQQRKALRVVAICESAEAAAMFDTDEESGWLSGVLFWALRWFGIGSLIFCIPATVIAGIAAAGSPNSMATTLRLCILFYLHAFTQFFIVLRIVVKPLVALSQTPPANQLPNPSKVVAPRMNAATLAKVLKERRSFSFDGCSWLMTFHLGVATALVDAMGWSGVSQLHFCGSSCGSLIATALACHVDLKAMRTFVFDMLDIALTRALGPVGIMTAFVKGGLTTMLPDNAHDLAASRLTISLSALHPAPRNVRASSWSSREDLIACCLASCYIPVYYEVPVEFQGSVCLDGGLTDNQPVADAKTVTVSPWARGDAVIKATQDYPSSFSLFPGSKADMEAVYWDGYKAAVAYMAGEGWLSDSDAFDVVDETGDF